MIPKISVVMPVFNGSKFLSRALDSLVFQSFENWELVAVDDGSTDESPEILSQACERDARIRVFHHIINRGPGAARNFALGQTRGTYISYLDCDDEYYPNYLEQVYTWRNKSDVLVFSYDVVDEGLGILLPGQTVTWNTAQERFFLMERNISCPLGIAHRRDLLDKTGGFNESLILLEDWDLWKRFAHAGAEFVFVESKSGIYHIRRESQSRTARIPQASRLDTGLQLAPGCLQDRWSVASEKRMATIRQNRLNYDPVSASGGHAERTDRESGLTGQKQSEMSNGALLAGLESVSWNERFLAAENNLASIIILCCNELDYTRLCLESVLRSTQGAFELILVDNGSTDRTSDYLNAIQRLCDSRQPSGNSHSGPGRTSDEMYGSSEKICNTTSKEQSPQQ
jgi:glycosyltransferase involved in cell wall biosynthesis